MKLPSLLLSLMAVSFCGASSAQEQLPTFDQVRSQYAKSKDLTRVSFLYRRCAALQLNVAALLVRQKQAKAASDYETLAQHYMLMSEVVDREIDLYQRTKSNKPSETVNLAVKHLSEVYAQRMKENKIKRGEYFAEDVALEKEMDECLKPEALAKSLGR
jgi:hypothetical protein